LEEDQKKDFLKNYDQEATEKATKQMIESMRIDNDFIGIDNILLWVSELDN